MSSTPTQPQSEQSTQQPAGELALQTIAMPADSNMNGDIFGGWLVSQMDLAGALTANRISKGRVATVAIDSMVFHRPVSVGSSVTCFAEVQRIGRTSIVMLIEAWAQKPTDMNREKVTEGKFTFVAIDDDGNSRVVPKGE